MEVVVYLERLLEVKIAEIQGLPAPPEEQMALGETCKLWNVCIQLQLKFDSVSPPPTSLLHELSKLREYCCCSFATVQPSEDMLKFWARTGKAYLDCGDYPAADSCFQRAEEAGRAVQVREAVEAFYSFYKWSLELCVKRDGNIGDYIPRVTDLVQSLPGERLNLCFFLYREVAYPLSQQSQFAHCVTALNACIALASDCPRTKVEEVVSKARTLLCAVYLELQAVAKAKDLVKQLPNDSAALALQVKILIQTDGMSGFQDLIGGILQKGAKCVEQVSDLLLGANQLMDACKLLWEAGEQLASPDLLLKWAKTLFCLVTMDPSLAETAAYLSTKAALDSVCKGGSCESVAPFLWNLSLERSHAEDFDGSSVILKKIIATCHDSQLKHNAFVLMAQNLYRTGRMEAALEALMQTQFQQDGKVALLRLHVLLQMNAASLEAIEGTFACLRDPTDIEMALSEVLQQRTEPSPDWLEVQRLLCSQLAKLISNHGDASSPRLVSIVKFALQQATDPSLVLEYLNLCVDWPVLTGDDKEWLHRRAWNAALDLTPQPMAYSLFQLAGQLAKSPEDRVRCTLAACHACFSSGVSSKYTESLSILRKLKTDVPTSLSSLFLEVEFEGLLVTSPGDLAEYLEQSGVSPEGLKTAAGVAFRLRQQGVASMCLKQFLQVAGHTSVEEVAAVYRELVSMAGSSDESFCYVEQAVKVAMERKYPREELEWLLAVCWNNGVKCYRLDKLVWAERWMAVAMRLVERSESAYSEQMRKVYAEVLKQRYE